MAVFNKCKYWNCNQTAQLEDMLCREHYRAWKEFEISECPICGKFKDNRSKVCMDCYGKQMPAM